MKAQFSSHTGFTTPAITDNRMWWERDPITASFIEIAKKQSEKYEVLNEQRSDS